MVVGDQHPDGHGTSRSGSSATTDVPALGPGSTVQLPPSSAARSAIAVMPDARPGRCGHGDAPPVVGHGQPQAAADDGQTTLLRVAPEWRTTLVNASVAIR